VPESGDVSPGDARRRPPPSGRVNNRDRILATSLDLFNERGAPAVSTNTIAADLGLSPGNLYYHFANKEQIIRELWAQVEELAAPVVDIPQDGSFIAPAGLAAFFVASIDAIWRFRFFFRDIDELVARDPEFAQAYRSEAAWGRARLAELCTALIDDGAMRAPGHEDVLERICINVQLVFTNWIRFVTTALGSETVGAGEIAAGGLHAFAVIEPYLDTDYADQTRAALQRHLAGATATKPKKATPTSRRRRS
jgi:AcrR family transcriptional regulator